MKLELFIDGKKIDLFDDEAINLTYSISDIREIFSKNTTYSKSFKIPGTPNNNEFFSFIFDIKANSTSFNSNRLINAQLYKDSILILDGLFQLLDIDIDELNKTWIYNGTLTTNIINFYSKIKEKNLQDINYFKNLFDPYATSPDEHLEYIKDSWTAFTANPNQNPFVFPLVDINKGWVYSTNDNYLPVSPIDIPRAVGVKKIVDEIFRDANYQYQSNFFNSQYFKNLIILSEFKGIDIEYDILIKTEFNLNFNAWFGDNTYSVLLVANNIFLSGTTRRIIEEVETTIPFLDNTRNSPIFQNVILKGTTQIFPGEKLSVVIAMPPTSWTDNRGGTSFFRNRFFVNSGSTFAISYLPPLNEDYKFKVMTEVPQWGNVGPNISPNGGFPFTSPEGVTGERYAEYTINWTGPAYPPYTQMGIELYDDRSIFDDINGIYHLANRALQSMFLPVDVKQSEFLNWLINLFNLYIDIDKSTGKIIIEPRDDYYSNNTITRDWTKILDISKSQNIQLISSTQPKNYKFTYKEDDDDLNKNYQDTYEDEVYGQKIVTLDNDFLNDRVEISHGFSPSPLANLTNSTQILIPKIYKDDVGDTISFNPRLLYWNGLQPLQNEFLFITRNWNNQVNYSTSQSAIFSASITNGSINVYSDVQVGCTSDINFNPPQFCVQDLFVQIIEFQNETQGSPNWISPSSFKALQAGFYDFSVNFAATINKVASPNILSLVRCKYYFNHYNSNNQLINRYLFYTHTHQSLAPNEVAFITGSLTNFAMNVNDYILIGVYVDIGGPNVDITWSNTISSGQFLSANNRIITPNGISLFNYYPYASEFVGKIGEETETIMYAPPNTVYYSNGISSTYPDLGLYKKYWSNYISQIDNADSKIYTAYFNLNEGDISQIQFNNLIYVDGSYYRINKINYIPTSDDTTKVELLKLESIQERIQNQQVIVSNARIGNSLGFNNVQGISNNLNSFSSVIGNNNSANKSIFTEITGQRNIINGFSTNITINGDNNFLSDNLRFVNIIGSNNTVSYSNSSIINGSNNYIGAISSSTQSLTGLTGTTISEIPSNVVLIGVSNVTASTPNTVWVPNLNILGDLVIEGNIISNNSILIPKLQVRIMKWDDTVKRHPIYFQWYNTGDERWKNYNPEIWLFRQVKSKTKKYTYIDGILTLTGSTIKPSRWVHPIDFNYTANTYTSGGKNLDGTNKINWGDTHRSLKTEWKIENPALPFFPADISNYPDYYNIRTFLDWNPESFYSYCDLFALPNIYSAVTNSIFPLPITNYNIRRTNGKVTNKVINFAFAIVIRDPNKPDKIIYGPMSDIIRCKPKVDFNSIAPTNYAGLHLSLWNYPIK